MRVLACSLTVLLCSAASVSAKTIYLEFAGRVSHVEDQSGGLKVPIDTLFPTGAPLFGQLGFEGNSPDSVLSPAHGHYQNAISALFITVNGLSMNSRNGFISVANDYGAGKSDFVSYNSNASQAGLAGDLAYGNAPSQFLLSFGDDAGRIFHNDHLPNALTLSAFTDVIGKLGYVGQSPACWAPGPGATVCSAGTQFVNFTVNDVSLSSSVDIPVGGSLGYLLMALAGGLGLRRLGRRNTSRIAPVATLSD